MDEWNEATVYEEKKRVEKIVKICNNSILWGFALPEEYEILIQFKEIYSLTGRVIYSA